MTNDQGLHPITDIAQAYDYLNSFTDFERCGFHRHFADTVSLDTIRALLAHRGDPHLHLPSIHIAGTKGKGSVATIIAAALHHAGYNTGLYTSPHLVTPTERIRINNTPLSEDELVSLVRALQPSIQSIQARTDLAPPTFFEIYTALAFVAFTEADVDIAVVETGLGGRLDATNVIDPLVAVITPISHDHTEILGPTLSEIAAEKAGIIKPHRPVIIAPQDPAAHRVLTQHTTQCGARVIIPPPVRHHAPVSPVPIPAPDEPLPVLRQSFTLKADSRDLRITTPLLGHHQATNAAVAYATLQALATYGFSVDDRQFVQSIANLTCPGRIQIVAARPWLVLDCAHNRASAAALAATLPRHLSYDKLVSVLGVSADKDAEGIIAELGEITDEFVVTQAHCQRALPAADLSALVTDHSSRAVHTTSSVSQALSVARRLAGPTDAICITGSFFVVGEVMEELGIEA